MFPSINKSKSGSFEELQHQICHKNKSAKFAERLFNVTHNRKDTVYLGRKVGETSVVPDPRAAYHVRGQYSGLVSASGI